MAARSIGTASISFGLVAIPIKMYPATSPSAGVSFHLLDQETGERVRQQYIRPSDGKIVARSEMVKGYEFAKDQYVTFTPDELKALEEKASQTIDITEFVPLEEVDPVYFDKPYYLGPEKGGEKAYRLLAEVMDETKRCAVARWAARGKQYLVLLRPRDGRLVMQQLLYSDEVREVSDVPMPDNVTVREPELKLARQLVDGITHETFDPTQYKDDVRERILADIQKKVEGKEIEVAPTEQQPAQVIDLMEALKASLAAHDSGGAAAKPAKGKAAANGKTAARRGPKRTEAADHDDAEAHAPRAQRKANARTHRR
jgi:DNA end-binding protein Ku